MRWILYRNITRDIKILRTIRMLANLLMVLSPPKAYKMSIEIWPAVMFISGYILYLLFLSTWIPSHFPRPVTAAPGWARRHTANIINTASLNILTHTEKAASTDRRYVLFVYLIRVLTNPRTNFSFFMVPQHPQKARTKTAPPPQVRK